MTKDTRYPSIPRIRDVRGNKPELLKTIEHLIPKDELLVETEKIHGVNCQMHIKADGAFTVGGRDGKPINFGQEALFKGMEYVPLCLELRDKMVKRYEGTEIIVYFELAGGSGKNQIQPEINYSSKQFIYIFDIYSVKHDEYMSYEALHKVLTEELIDHKKLKFFNECIIFDNTPTFSMYDILVERDFKKLGLMSKMFPKAQREGGVIRGWKRDIVVSYQAEGAEMPIDYRIILKNINPNFEEVKATPVAKIIPMYDTVVEKVCTDIKAYCTYMRLSKIIGNIRDISIVEINMKNFGKFVMPYIADVIKDFNEINSTKLDDKFSGLNKVHDAIRKELRDLVVELEKKTKDNA